MKDTYAAGEGSGEEAPKVSQLCSDLLYLAFDLYTSCSSLCVLRVCSALLLPESPISSSLHQL